MYCKEEWRERDEKRGTILRVEVKEYLNLQT